MVKENKDKGFTLVELIVVLVILAILAAILVPALMGYIDRAKEQKYIDEAKALMTATQAGIAEAYGKDYASFKNAIRTSGYSPIKEQYGYYSNYALYIAKQGDEMAINTDPTKENGARAKNIISKSVVKYADSFPYNFMKDGPDNKTLAELGNQVGFTIIFNGRGKILRMQYGRDERLVTYDGNSFSVETGKNVKFSDFRNK